MSRVGFRVWGFGFGGPKEPEEIAQDVFRFRVPCFSFVSRFSVFGFLVLVLFLDFWVPGCQLQVSDFWFRLSGFGSQDFGLGVGPKNQPEEIAEDVFGFRVSDFVFGFRVWSSRFHFFVFGVSGFGFRIPEVGCREWGFGCEVSGLGFRAGGWTRKAARRGSAGCGPSASASEFRSVSTPASPREFVIDNLLVRIHLIIEMILVDRPCAMRQHLH